MKKRIFSLAVVIILLGLYAATFFVACFTTKETGGLFMACLFATVMFPILLYGYQLVLKGMQGRNQDKDKENREEK